MSLVTLKNGNQENMQLVAATMGSLRAVMAQDYIAFYELVKNCRDRSHKFYGDTGAVLKRFNLVDVEGSVSQSICNVVLAAVKGEGMQTSIVSPIKEVSSAKTLK